VAQIRVVFVEDRVTRPIIALSVRRAALDYETVDEPVEGQAVVVGGVGSHRAVPNIDPRLFPRCKADEIRTSARGFFVFQEDAERAQRRASGAYGEIRVDLRMERGGKKQEQ
jgi:hypothetical protein